MSGGMMTWTPKRTALKRAVVAIALGAGVAALSPWAAAGSAAPVTDPNAAGSIGLCDVHGKPIVAGSTTTAPFVWTAVSSLPAPGQYRGRGENTILNIYQVRSDVDPSEWSGDSMTAASFYKTAAVPVAQATRADIPLSQILAEFPPQQDGLYQLRMYYGRTDYGVYSQTYPATTIQVTGDDWQVIDPPKVDCGSGTAVSNEVLTGVVKSAAPPRDGPVAGAVRPSSSSHAGRDTAIGVVAGVIVVAIAAAAWFGPRIARARRRGRGPDRRVQARTAPRIKEPVK